MIVLDVEVTCDAPNMAIGLAAARGCGPANVDDAVAKAVALRQAAPTSDELRKAVRDMLRFGKYKPTGRGKPASEYLLQAAQESQFPRISPLVDLCNVVSLETGLPISLIDLQRAATRAFLVRRGRAQESYVFNAGGQTIDLEDLLLTARLPEDEPCANAVKDSMATKLGADATDVLAVIYAPKTLASVADQATKALVALYRDLTHATQAEGAVLHA